MLLMHLFVYFAGIDFCPSLPLGVKGWLWLVIVALPECSVNFLEEQSQDLLKLK